MIWLFICTAVLLAGFVLALVLLLGSITGVL